MPVPGTCVLALEGPVAPAEVRRMCERVRLLLERTGAGQVICDVRTVVTPDAGTVEVLARMQLTARRLGRRMKLRGACGELRELLLMSGLSDVLPCEDLYLEPRRQAEEREPSGGVEEERDPADPVA